MVRQVLSKPGTSLAVVAIVATIAIFLAGAVKAHVDRDGHPVIVERVGGIASDVAEIKADVKTILDRLPTASE